MGVAVLHPEDCLKHPLSHMKYPRNPTASSNRQKKPLPNRSHRSPPRNQVTKSPPLPHTRSPVVVAQVRILKRGEEIPLKTTDLGSTRRIGPDPGTIPSQICLSGRKSKAVPFYAGPVTMTSPPPSDVPLPGFFTTKKSVSLFKAADATNDLIRILRLEIA